jgi:hypothetical protein
MWSLHAADGQLLQRMYIAPGAGFTWDGPWPEGGIESWIPVFPKDEAAKDKSDEITNQRLALILTEARHNPQPLTRTLEEIGARAKDLLREDGWRIVPLWDEDEDAPWEHQFERTIPTDGRWCQKCGLSEAQDNGDPCVPDPKVEGLVREINYWRNQVVEPPHGDDDPVVDMEIAYEPEEDPSMREWEQGKNAERSLLNAQNLRDDLRTATGILYIQELPRFPWQPKTSLCFRANGSVKWRVEQTLNDEEKL